MHLFQNSLILLRQIMTTVIKFICQAVFFARLVIGVYSFTFASIYILSAASISPVTYYLLF